MTNNYPGNSGPVVEARIDPLGQIQQALPARELTSPLGFPRSVCNIYSTTEIASVDREGLHCGVKEEMVLFILFYFFPRARFLDSQEDTLEKTLQVLDAT